MADIQTVTGPVSPAQLGRTLMHEHVITRSLGLETNYPDTYPRAEILALAIEKLSRLKAAGVDTIIDHTTVDLGRDIELIAEASEKSGIQIVAATGLWHQPPRFFQLLHPEKIAEYFLRDINEGVAGTGIKCGVIKSAIDTPGLTPPILAAVQAAAIAHRATGIPISTHSWAATYMGVLHQDVFTSKGVDLSRVVIGHSGDSEDYGYLEEIARRGSVLGMDRFGLHNYLETTKRVAVVAELCKRGLASKMVLSHDANCWNDRMDQATMAVERADWHFHHILDVVLPALRERGVSEADIDQMMVHNPARIMEPGAPY